MREKEIAEVLNEVILSVLCTAWGRSQRHDRYSSHIASPRRQQQPPHFTSDLGWRFYLNWMLRRMIASDIKSPRPCSFSPQYSSKPSSDSACNQNINIKNQSLSLTVTDKHKHHWATFLQKRDSIFQMEFLACRIRNLLIKFEFCIWWT